jgi:hypothetical protein
MKDEQLNGLSSWAWVYFVLVLGIVIGLVGILVISLLTH